MPDTTAAESSTPVAPPATPQLSASLSIWMMLRRFVRGDQAAYIDAGDGEERWHWVLPDAVATGHPPVVELATDDEAAVLDALDAEVDV